MSSSPYAPPRAAIVDAYDTTSSNAESIRREHIRHEIQLKSVGLLYILGGVFAMIGMISIVTVMFVSPTRPRADAAGVLIGVIAIYLVLGAASLTIGYGFRKLKPWVRIPGGILSALGLLGIPIGTLINGWILYLMFGKKGQVVLGPDYQNIIAATPHVKYQRTVGDWIALGILVLLIVGVIGLLIAARMQ